MIWLDEDLSLNDQAVSLSSLSSKFKAFNDEMEERKINIICENKEIAKNLLISSDQLHDRFECLNLRIGWFQKDVHNLTEVFEDETVFIGHGDYCRSFEKVFGNNTCKISRKAGDNSLHVAYQRHFSDHRNPRSISLGELTEKIHHVDPLLRGVDGIFFYLDTIRKQESLLSESFVSGITIDQACALSRYSGMSQSNKMIYFNIGDHSINDHTAQTVALLLWYYLEGSANRFIEKLDHVNNHTYMVSNPYFEQPVKFIRTNITGRWWYQHPEDKYYVPCTEEDYRTISAGKLPDAFLMLE